MNVHFTDKQKTYISDQISSGDYQNASELVREALRMHQLYRHQVLKDLQVAVQKGIDSGTSNRSVKDIIASNT